MVGGGRWARVYLTTLITDKFPYQLVVVSTHNFEKLASSKIIKEAKVQIVPSLKDLIDCYQVVAAIIVNSARLHVFTAKTLIKLGVPVLVEKPIALSEGVLKELYDLTLLKSGRLMPAFTYMYCNYLREFSKIIRNINDTLVVIELVWKDSCDEVRDGEIKSYDPSISVAQDVMPHVWTILAEILGPSRQACKVEKCQIERGGRQVTFDITFSSVPCKINLERDSNERRRFLLIKFKSRQQVSIDFTEEPGVISDGSSLLSADPNWKNSSKPVSQMLQDFNLVLNQTKNIDLLSYAAFASVALLEKSDELLKQTQKVWLLDCPNSTCIEDIEYALGELNS